MSTRARVSLGWHLSIRAYKLPYYNFLLDKRHPGVTICCLSAYVSA